MKLLRIIQTPFFFLSILVGYLLLGVLTGIAGAILYVEGKIDWSTKLCDVRRILENEAEIHLTTDKEWEV